MSLDFISFQKEIQNLFDEPTELKKKEQIHSNQRIYYNIHYILIEIKQK